MNSRHALLALLAGGLALAALPWLLSDFLLALALSCVMYAGLAVSWSMFCGPTNYLSLATAAFFGLGTYVTAWGAGALPYGLSVLAGGLVAAGFAALIGAAVLHLRGAYFAVITFGMGELVRHGITYYEKAFEGTVGRIIAEAPESTTVYWMVLLVSMGAVAAAVLVRDHRLGLALRGIGSDEERAQTLGVNARRSKIAAFALSAFFAGALGAAMAVRWTYIDPLTVFNPFIGFQTVLIAMVGGAQTILGPIASAVVFGLLTEFLRLQFPYLFLVILGFLLILLVLYLPGGIASLFERWRWRRGNV
ncbi:MAG: branched-chain amino acid ABC transporter permease [Betaproteobacteria bacterium]|nr:branched-chain amino acid ABC transporter permease [Betaproteobacteria bacterium]MDH5221873.1 branched-chain amino acid ABC transporter permease [Betaproteobacteria bacterium]MDH5349235.1 branched-chain amino acid ABC transporter permease [Betaproteobacteria bacterium]